MFCPKCGKRSELPDARFCPFCACEIGKLKELFSGSPSGQEVGSPLNKMTFDIPTPLEEVEKRMILATLKALGHNKTRTAEQLKISLKTLHNKLNEYRGSNHDPHS